MAYVYRHIRLDKNEPFYIGIGTDNKYSRAYSKDSRNKIWQKIIDKTKYEVEILLDDLSIEDAFAKEIEFIDLYKRKCDNGILANLSKGGEGGTFGLKRSKESVQKGVIKRIGLKRTEESKIKMSNAAKGKIVSESTREKMRARMMGNSYTLGRKLSDEHKLCISKKNKGRKQATTICPHCNLVGAIPVLKRFHFDNCKFK